MNLKKRGFTLIEVIVALAILLSVIVFLLGNYYSYYNYVKTQTYNAIGQNLAQLMLEETRSLGVSILDSLVKGGQYPSSIKWETYDFYDENSSPPVYMISSSQSEKIVSGIPYPKDTNPDNTIYDSGKIDSSFRLENISAVFGRTDGTIDTNSDSYKNLPDNISINPVYHSDVQPTYYDYTILLNKETFPNYQRRIVIRDLTPSLQSYKLYKISVTIYWTVGGKIDPQTGQVIGGIEKSITITGEKTYTP